MAAVVKRYEWTLVIIMFFVWGTLFLDRMSVLYLAPYIAPDLHLRGQQVGMLAAIIAATWAISSLVFGWISDKVGRLKILVPMIFMFSILSILSGFAQNFGELLLARAVMGIAEGPCWSVMNALVEQSSTRETRARNVAIVLSAAALVGLGLAPVLSTQIAAHFGWRVAFFIVGIPGLALGVLTMIFVKEPVVYRKDEVIEAELRVNDVRALLVNRNILLSCLGASGFLIWSMLYNAFGPLFITQVMGKSGTEAGFIIGAAGVGAFISMVFLTPFVVRYLRNRGTIIVAGIISLFLPMALLTPGLYAMPWLLAAIMFVSACGQIVAILTIVLIPASSVPPRLVASAIGLCTMISEIVGSVFAPIIAGSLIPTYGLGFPLEFAAFGMVLVLISGIFIKEPKISERLVLQTEKF
jgi:predicted MFS family arabinose efflux permease